MQYLYGVFFQAPHYRTGQLVAHWGMHRNGRTAKRIARRVSGYVTRMPLPSPEVQVWDAPTFKVCSELYSDYRK